MSDGHEHARDSWLKADLHDWEVWQEFLRRFPSEETCLEEICKMAYPSGYQCGQCQGTDVQKELGQRTVECNSCGATTWIFSGTFFQRMKQARPMLAAIWLREHGVLFNAFKFHKLLDIAYSSAHKLLHKLSLVVVASMQQDSTFEFPSRSFERAITRRSRETPARQHPRAELDEFESEFEKQHSEASEHDAFAEMHELDQMQSSILKQLARESLNFEALQSKSSISVADLSSALMILELKGLLERSANLYSRISPETDEPNGPEWHERREQSLSAAIRFLLQTYQGISRKYLQIKVADFWCFIDRGRWGLGSMVRVCMKHGPIRRRQLMSYISPLMIKVPRIIVTAEPI